MTLLERTLAELSDRYTGLPDDYRYWLRKADAATVERIYELALADAPGSEIAALLDYGALAEFCREMMEESDQGVWYLPG